MPEWASDFLCDRSLELTHKVVPCLLLRLGAPTELMSYRHDAQEVAQLFFKKAL